VRDPNPVLYFEHKHLFNLKGDLPDAPPELRLGRADVARVGSDLTIVATQLMRHRAVEAATVLAQDDLDAEVIDPRTLVPLDLETIVASLEKTNRLLVVQEAPTDGSWGASMIARLIQDHFESFGAPPRLLAAEDTPIPYSQPLETAWMPSVERIVAAAREVVVRR
jgi:pyruvate dehydrogenase E1 component beta subunit